MIRLVNRRLVERLTYDDPRGLPFGAAFQAPLSAHSFLREIHLEGRCHRTENRRGRVPHDLLAIRSAFPHRSIKPARRLESYLELRAGGGA